MCLVLFQMTFSGYGAELIALIWAVHNLQSAICNCTRRGSHQAFMAYYDDE
jgi:hypothetical protein